MCLVLETCGHLHVFLLDMDGAVYIICICYMDVIHVILIHACYLHAYPVHVICILGRTMNFELILWVEYITSPSHISISCKIAKEAGHDYVSLHSNDVSAFIFVGGLLFFTKYSVSYQDPARSYRYSPEVYGI